MRRQLSGDFDHLMRVTAPKPQREERHKCLTPMSATTKLIQYMNEAYGNEKELEVALVADIAMTTKPPYKKRLQQHLKETKGHAKGNGAPDQETRRQAPAPPSRCSAKRPRWRKARCTWSAATAPGRRC